MVIEAIELLCTTRNVQNPKTRRQGPFCMTQHIAPETTRSRWEDWHTWSRTAVGSPVDADVSLVGIVKTFSRKSSTGRAAWAPWTDALPGT